MSYIIRPMEMADIPEVMEIERQCFSMPWPASAYRRELRDNRLSRYIVVEWVEEQTDVSSLRTTGAAEVRGQSVARAQARSEGQRVAAQSGSQIQSRSQAQTRSLVKRALDYILPSFGREEPRPSASRLAGYAGFWLMLDEAHVTTIAVRPSLRGQGLGELLFIGVIDMAAALGARFVTLEVRVSNYVAQQLYKKFGFREEGIRRHYYSDNGEDALIMWSEPLGSASFQNRLVRLKAELDKKLAHARPPIP